MAWINYVPSEQIDAADRVEDDDNILRIHGVHASMMRKHYDLYVQVMHRPSPLSRAQREMIATVVSTINHCHY